MGKFGQGFFLTRRPDIHNHWRNKKIDSGALILLVFSFMSRPRRETKRGTVTLERLFSVYKIENDQEILLGGLVERRKSRRGRSDQAGLLEMAKKKFAESPDDDFTIVLREEK